MKRVVGFFIGLVFSVSSLATAAEKDLEIQGRRLISQRPPFTITLPSELRWIHSSVAEQPELSSLTRAYFYVKERGKQVEEMFILQIADRTNPMAEPMTLPPLKGDTEKGLYLRQKVRKEKGEIEFLIQGIAWNPKAPSLQPIIKKGITIPSHLVLQGQALFGYGGEHAVLMKHSRDVSTFGVEVSGKGRDWSKDSLSGNEKKAYEAYQKIFKKMIDSLTFPKP